MKKTSAKNQIPTQLPIHFKTPGRSYSQIGRKGNVALYSVYSDYFLLHGFRLPFLLIGFELVCIKTKYGRELYPRDEDFGHSAWSIPKSFKSFGRVCLGFCRSTCKGSRLQTFKTFLNRSASSTESEALATA